MAEHPWRKYRGSDGPKPTKKGNAPPTEEEKRKAISDAQRHAAYCKHDIPLLELHTQRVIDREIEVIRSLYVARCRFPGCEMHV